MNGLIRKATLLSLGVMTAAGVGNAGTPNSTNSTQPPGILLVGYYNPPDSRGTFTYTIRDGNNVAVPNTPVVINFTACTDVRLCSTQGTPPAAPTAWNDAANTLTVTTDGLGQVTLTLVGAGNNGGTPRAVNDCATVTAGGQAMNALAIATLDQSNSGGANGADRTIWLSDFAAYAGGAGTLRERSDYDRNHIINGADDVFFKAAFAEAGGGLGTGSALSCGDVVVP
jgi:hypothetical protein